MVKPSWRIAGLLLLILLFSSSVCYAYIYNGVWWNAGYATYNYGDTLPSSMQAAVQKGAGTWNAAPSSFYFTFDSSSGNQWWYGSIDGMFGTVATTWWDDLFGRLYDCDTKFDSDEIWNTDVTRPPYNWEEDAWSVAAHEFGHWLSLGHSYSSPDGYRPTMDDRIDYGLYYPRDLAQDDKNGIWYIYETLH
jgi:hypothetical protein